MRFSRFVMKHGVAVFAIAAGLAMTIGSSSAYANSLSSNYSELDIKAASKSESLTLDNSSGVFESSDGVEIDDSDIAPSGLLDTSVPSEDNSITESDSSTDKSSGGLVDSYEKANSTNESINEEDSSQDSDDPNVTTSDAKPSLSEALSGINDGHPDNGWFINKNGELTYWVNGILTAPDHVWYTDDQGNRTYFLDGEAVSNPNYVSYTDPASGEKYWYENGKVVKDHSFYVGEDFDAPGLEKGYWYWADEDGIIAHGKDVYIPNDEQNRIDGGGKWVRIRDDHTMLKGEDYRIAIDDGQWHWWLFDLTTGAMQKNFSYVSSNGGKWVYYDDTFGWMVYGEQYRQTKDDLASGYHWYYFDNYTGATTYGYKWLSDPSDGYWGGKTVFYDRSMGWMLYGWQNISGTWNYFNRYTGRQCSSTNAARSATQWLNWAGSGCGATNNFYVMVDKTNLRCMTFERDNGVWVPTNDFLCSVAGSNGNHGAGTVEGFWHLGLLTNAEKGITNGSLYDHGPNGFGAQIDNFVNSGSTGLVWSGGALAKIENDKFANTMYRYHYVQDQGIHSTVGGDHPEQLGQRNTDGCVRLGYTDCRWIFNCIPMYTTIRIYSDVRF